MKFTMNFWNIILVTQLVSLVGAEGDGINFCDKICFCDTGLVPVEINCDEKNLKSIWEEEDWNVTLTALNLTINDAIYATFYDNQIEHVPRFPQLNITILSLQMNQIKSIERSAFAELENLETLNLANNELNSDAIFEGIFFGKYKNNNTGYFPLPLRRLNLSYNDIHSIPIHSFDHFANLISIDLSHNPLVTLDGNSKSAIGVLLKLEFLGLSNTSISKIPEGTLHDLRHLNALDMSYNLFKTVPTELSYSHELEVLNLDGNLLENLNKDSFQELSYLKDLSICNIRTLRTIEEFTFTPLKNLTKLTLAFNPHLKDIDTGAFEGLIETEEEESKWPVKEIYINDNGLRHIDPELVPWTEVDVVNIQNNPFRCDCNLGWMVQVLVERIRLSNPTLTVDLVCAEPKEMKGQSINSLTKQPELFQRCRSGKKDGNFVINEYNPAAQDPYKAAGVTVLVIGILLIAIGLSILGFVVIKRRAITQSLMAPSQIRYERADTEDGSEWKYSQNSSRDQPGIFTTTR